MSLSSEHGGSGQLKQRNFSKNSLAHNRNARAAHDDPVYPPFLKQMEAQLPDFEREGDIEYPFEEVNGAGDENRVRGNWSGKTDYLLAVVGFTFGIGNLARFPFLVFRHGGAAFLVPYLISVAVAAVPMFLIETVLGQFSSLAALSIWNVVPLFKGVGIAMVILSCLLAIYLNVVSAWSLFYLFNSVSFSLPWSNCANSWSGLNCTLGARSQCVEMNGTLLVNGSCAVNETTVLFLPHAAHTGIPSMQYFHKDVLMLSSAFDHIGTLNWYLGICVLISWIIVFLCLFQGVKSSGKVVYVMVVLPYVLICVLLARLLTLDGSLPALLHFMTPDWTVLHNPVVWGEAAVQAFYSLSCCTGGLITLASYNRFHNNLFRDVWMVVSVDVMGGLLACALTFSAIGFTCFQFNISLDKFQISDGAHLVFVFLAEALAGLPVAPLYAGIYFLMLLLILLSTQLFVVESIVTSLCDEFPERLRKNRRHVLTSVCAIFILLSIPFCTSAGLYWLLLLSHFTITWPLLAIAFLECMAISWIYGVDNLLDNIKWVTGSYPPCYMFWKTLWKFICPAVYLAILCFVWLEWHTVRYESYIFPEWTSLLGWSISLAPIVMVPVAAVVEFAMARGNCTQRWRCVLNPRDAWGPALAVHRAEHFPLQIPEARRLLLPPEEKTIVIGTPAPQDVLPPNEETPPRQTKTVSTPRSNAATIHTTRSIQPTERETAI